MNAPETHVQHSQPMIALASIIVSKTNPRKTFDPAKLEELTDSVKLKGVLQPILVRPAPKGGFEIVAGERRFKAAKAAGLVEIPVTVRVLTDAEALELQVIENNQREDLHPLEEAEGFEALMKCEHPDGTPYTVNDIATKVGKSKAYVYQKLKLCACSKDVRKAFYDGKIDFSKALLLARIHGDDLQRQALNEITEETPYYGQMTFRRAQQHVQARYMLALDKAPFSTTDEKLVPKAGACTTCPKRTGNAPELFADVKSGDVCTDPECFQSKRIAVVSIKKASAIAGGQTVISGKAAKQVMPHEHGISSGYVTATAICYDDPKQRTYAEIIGPATKPIILENPHRDAELLDIYRVEDIKPILKEKGAIRPSRRSDTRSSTKKKATSATAAPKVDQEELFRKRLFLELCAKMPTALGKEDLAAIALDLVEFSDNEVETVAEALLPTKDGKNRERWQCGSAIAKAVPQLDLAGLSRLVMALFYAKEVEYCHGKPERMLDAAKRWKVDPAKVRKALDAEAKAAKQLEAAAKKAIPITPKKAAAAFDKMKRKIAGPAGKAVVVKVRPGQKVKPMTTIAAKKAKAAKRKPVASFMKPMTPSTELAAIVGADPLKRTDVTSKVWGYIKKHNLQDKTNRRMINTDATLGAVMAGKKQVSMFEMTKLLAKHLK